MKETMNTQEVYSEWSNKIYPCAEGCGYIGELDAFRHGQCYDPCPKCGGSRDQRRTGRFVYRLEPLKWSPFIKRKKFVRVEWRDCHYEIVNYAGMTVGRATKRKANQ